MLAPDRLWTADAMGILERTTASDAPRGRPPQGKEAMVGIIEAPTMASAVRATIVADMLAGVSVPRGRDERFLSSNFEGRIAHSLGGTNYKPSQTCLQKPLLTQQAQAWV